LWRAWPSRAGSCLLHGAGDGARDSGRREAGVAQEQHADPAGHLRADEDADPPVLAEMFNLVVRAGVIAQTPVLTLQVGR
jgi:hypothetical protein